MRLNIPALAFVALVSAVSALAADTVKMAGSEDLDAFNDMLGSTQPSQQKPSVAAPVAKAVPGTEIAEEARKLRTSDQETRRSFGKWVKAQKRGSPGAEAAKGKTFGDGAGPGSNRGDGVEGHQGGSAKERGKSNGRGNSGN